LTYIGDVLAKFEILVAMVYIYVAGLLVVVGGVQSDETDRLWSEALFTHARFRCKHSILKVTGYNNMSRYQGSAV
jgi:hypothetical protein